MKIISKHKKKKKPIFNTIRVKIYKRTMLWIKNMLKNKQLMAISINKDRSRKPTNK